MHIWIDGDACPKKIKDILFRAAIRRKVPTTLVANHVSSIPPSPFIKRLQVESGFDKADHKILASLKTHDLVITADIPLASEVIAKGGVALNPRGTLYTNTNIKQKLAMRDFNESLRECGMMSSGLDKLSDAEIRQFANHLDTILAKKSR